MGFLWTMKLLAKGTDTAVSLHSYFIIYFEKLYHMYLILSGLLKNTPVSKNKCAAFHLVSYSQGRIDCILSRSLLILIIKKVWESRIWYMKI